MIKTAIVNAFFEICECRGISMPIRLIAKRALPIAALLLLAACQRYEWVHPTKSLAQFGRDRLSCEERAARLYPAEPVTIREPGMFIERGIERCWRTSSGYVRCHSPRPIFVPPSYSTRDVNEDDRTRTIEACLISKGYELVPAK